MTPKLLGHRATRVRYGWADTPVGRLLVAASERGVCAIELGAIGDEARSLASLADFARRRLVGPELVADAGAVREACLQLAEYFDGRRRSFELPLDLHGSPFAKSVWRQLLGLGFGETVSYGELARRLGIPGASRAVGRANGSNPVPIVVPCHRVLAAGGRLGGFSAGLETKRRLLALEGLLLDVDGIVRG